MKEPKYFQTQTDLRRHNRRTRKARVKRLCEKHNTTSYAQAAYADTLELCARLQLATLCKRIERATIEGDFALGAKLSNEIHRLKAIA